MKHVCCVMLANGRHEMVKRAVAAFQAQDYPAAWLLIWNTGNREDFLEHESGDVAIVYSPEKADIGTLRNRANMGAFDIFPDECDVYAHWDSDDWSHPKRISEQVESLENSRADVVGYYETLFYDSTVCPCPKSGSDPKCIGEAWTYRALNPKGIVGASMLYPRETWEKARFPAKNIGEDTFWLLHNRFKIQATPSSWSWRGLPWHEPRMICGLHGGNTSSKIIPSATEWNRSPGFDAYCRERMK